MMETNEDRIMGKLMESFNRVSEKMGPNMDSLMADYAVHILLLKDGNGQREFTFFDKAVSLLCDCSDLDVIDNIKACMFWWVFNEEIIQNAVSELMSEITKKL